MEFRDLKRLIVGNPLSSEKMHHELIPKWKALAVLSSDALSSVAYATEEVLIPLSIFATTAVAPNIPLVVLKSPFRSVIAPIVDYVGKVALERSDSMVTVIIPEFVTTRWYHQLLHNQTAIVLNLALRGRKGIVVTAVRYHLEPTSQG